MRTKTNSFWLVPATNRISKIGLGLASLLMAMVLLGVNYVEAAPTIGLPQFQQLFDFSDKAVVEGRASRSWTWGPVVSELLSEPYTQGGNRKVQYFEKTRMEQTEGRGVTNGLLAKELITGLLQLGDQDFRLYEADSSFNIAGDQGGTLPNPTYASFRKVTTINPGENKATDQTGQPVMATIDRKGTVGANPALGPVYNVKGSFFEATLSHNIPSVFWDFLNQTGPVFKDGQYVTEQVFNWVTAVGLPLSEAYWTRAVLAGKEQDILVQAFERRVMTYTPANPKAYQVEMGNVGQHYLAWRTKVTTAPPPTPAPPPGPINVPAVPVWTSPTRLVPSQEKLFNPTMKARPTDGVAFIIGEPGQPEKLALTNSRDPNNWTNIHEIAPNGQKRPHMSFAADGTGYFVWRYLTEATGFLAYMRKMSPDGSLQKGTDLNRLWRAAGGIEDIDLPDIYVSRTSGKVYMVGQTKTYKQGGPGLGFAESSNGAASFGGATLIAGPDSVRGEIKPTMCGDKDDNLHVAAYWDGNLVGISRINGKWSRLNFLTDRDGVDFFFGGFHSITCTPDGYAYVTFKSVNANNTGNSIGLARYAPGEGWRRMSYDIYGLAVSRNFGNSIPGAEGTSVTVTPDGRVWVASGINGGPYTGVLVASSTDKGQTFGNLHAPIRYGPSNAGVQLDYSIVNNQTRLYIAATFKEPADRVSYYTETKP